MDTNIDIDHRRYVMSYNSNHLNNFDDTDEQRQDALLTPDEVHADVQMNRILMEGFSHEDFAAMEIPQLLIDDDFDGEELDMDHLRVAGASPSTAADAKTDGRSSTNTSSYNQPYEQLIDSSTPLPSYTLPMALQQINLYSNSFALLIYDPNDDMFIALYSKKHHWASSVQKLLLTVRYLAYMLRLTFPDRFQGANSAELILPISSGDFPAVKSVECVARKQRGRGNDGDDLCGGLEDMEGRAPILHFGSVFRCVVF